MGKFKVFDKNGLVLKINDTVFFEKAPYELIHNLPEEDQAAIESFAKRHLTVDGFGENGEIEINFPDTYRTIWIKSCHLIKVI